MRKIPLTKGMVALVDDEDYDDLAKHKWHYTNTGYATRNGVLMHHVLIGKRKGFDVDHANGNGVDNRRGNIRHCTHAQNIANSPPRGGASKYKGVKRNGKVKRWRATIMKDYKDIHIGYFDTEKEAALAYDSVARKYFGEFAYCNFKMN